MKNEKKLETLNRALRLCGFPANYFIYNEENNFLIKVQDKDGNETPHTPCMSYRELNAYLTGYYLALVNPVHHPIQFYVEYLNRDTNFEKDSKIFSSYGEALTWCKNNIPNFQHDMIKHLT